MISPLKATGIVAAGTVVSLATSVLVSKALALIVGPDGVGLYGLMVSVLNTLGVLFGVGLATALVRAIGEELGAGHRLRAIDLRSAALGLTIVLAAGSVVASILGSDLVAARIFNDPRLAGAVPLLGIAAGLTLIGSGETSALNGHHRITELALASVTTTLLGAFALVAAVALSAQDGIAVGLLAAAAVGLAVSAFITARTLGPPAVARLAVVFSIGRSLLTAGVPYAMSQVVSVGVQLAIQVIVLYQLDAEAVGYYRAAYTISVGYLAFILGTLAQDYYPRVAAARTDQLRELVERRTRLIVALGAPVILATLALAPYAVTLLYSAEFGPATSILRWQLIGDVLKLPAWAMAFAVLAKARARTFLGVELVGSVALVVAVAISIELFGLEGIGIGYLVSYAAYYVALWFAVRTVAPIVPGRLQATLLALVAILIITGVSAPKVEPIRDAALLVGAAVMAAIAWPRVWRLHRSGQL